MVQLWHPGLVYLRRRIACADQLHLATICFIDRPESIEYPADEGDGHMITIALSVTRRVYHRWQANY